MNIVTGYRGEPHITSNEIQGFNQGIFGSDNYVLNVGTRFNATLTTATTVTIQDGEGVIQGVHFRIAPGETDTVSISPGTSGYKRIDYICARYEKSAVTGIESVSLAVVEGTPATSSPSAPDINTGTILTGGTPVDFPLWEVDLNGLTPTLKSLVPMPTQGIGLMGHLYELPYYHSKGSDSWSKLFILPALNLMILNVNEELEQSLDYTDSEYGDKLPIVNNTLSGFYYNYVTATLIGEAIGTNYSLVEGKIVTYTNNNTEYSKFYLSAKGYSSDSRLVRGQIIATYKNLHPDYPLSSATLII